MSNNFLTIWELKIEEDAWMLVRTYPAHYAEQVLEKLDQKYPGRYITFPKGFNPNTDW